MASSKVFISPSQKYDRVIMLLDMDCFYCQVEEKLNPSLAGKPIAVVQYNAWRGGGIIAVNYPARAKGVTRHMRGEEAKEHCPEIELVRVPTVRDKADLSKYRDAGQEVADVLQTFTPLVERASVDEAYLDITEQVNSKFFQIDDGSIQINPLDLHNTYAVGYENFNMFIKKIVSEIGKDDDEGTIDEFEYEDTDMPAIRNSGIKLLIGACIANEIRAKVKSVTGYDCSAGIAHNKILAKLACGMNKPNKQTILPLKQTAALFRTLRIGKIKGLGGKFGEDVCKILNVEFLGDLRRFSESELQRKFDEKSGSWLYQIARGIDLEAVIRKFYSKSIGCSKKFPGRNSITGLNTLEHWLNELAKDIVHRLEKDACEHKRRATQIVVNYAQEINGEDVSSSRSATLPSYESEVIANICLETLKKNAEQFFSVGSNHVLNNPIKFLGITAGKFVTIGSVQNTLVNMFAMQKKKVTKEAVEQVPMIDIEVVEKKDVQIKEPVSFFAGATGLTDGLKRAIENEDVGTETDNMNVEKSYFMSFFSAERENSSNRSGIEEGTIHKIQEQIKANITSVASDRDECQETVELYIDETSNKERFQTSESQIETDDNDTIVLPQLKDASIKYDEIERCLSPDIVANDSTESFEIQVKQESIEQDYNQTYVELARPELRPENFIKCTQCGKQVLADPKSQQSHADRHFAEMISKEQREEFRNEQRAKFASQSQKKNKSSPKQKFQKMSTQQAPTILKYLRKTDEPDPDASSTDNEPKKPCPQCGKLFPLSKMTEHLDYHLAWKQQMEFNQLDRPDVQNSEMNPFSAAKRRKSQTGSIEAKKSKSISSYF